MIAPAPERLKNVAQGLTKALEEHAQAAADLAEAKHALDLACAHRLTVEPPQGRNAEERAAKLHMDTQAHHEMLYTREKALTNARLELDIARVQWDCLRYWIRLLEVAK